MTTSIPKTLIECKLFAHTDAALVQRYQHHFVEKSYHGGEILYDIGQEQSSLYIVQYGKVRFDFCAADGKEYLINIASDGNFFGEIELIENIPSLARAEVMEPSRLLLLPKNVFLRLYKDEHQIALNLVQLLASNIKGLMNRANKSMLKNTEYRLAGLLIQLYNRFGKAITEGHSASNNANIENNGRYIQLHLTHDELAKMVGSTRPTMNKLLTAWKEKGWLDFHYGKITIHNPQQFKEYYRSLSS